MAIGDTGAGLAKPRVPLALGLDPAAVLGDLCLSVGFGGKRTDLGRIGPRDTDLHGDPPPQRK